MAEYNLGTAHGTVKIDSDTTGVDQAGKSLENLGQKGQTTSQALDTVGNTMGVAGLAIAGGLGLAVKSASDFGAQLSGIAAVGGREAAARMDEIHDKALEIGKATTFSASEAAGAMSELVKAGIPVEDVLSGAADATVALAAATGTDMVTAATIASNAMNVFGIKAEDMGGTVDILAKTANASAIDIGDLGMSMQQVGAVANLAGLSLEDTAIAIGEMGDAGIKGSDAGTSLKTMLMNLQPSTEKASGLMSELGIITEDGTNRFYDQEGSLKSLRDIQDILSTSLAGTSDAFKQQALETIFGSDAIRAGAVLVDEGAAGYDNFTNKLNDQASAQEQAKIRQDNMKGSMEQLMGSLQNTGIVIGEVLIPPLRELLGWVQGLFDWFSELPGPMQTFITYGIAGAGALLLLGSGIIKVVGFFSKMSGAISTIIGALARKNAAEAASAGVSTTTSATSALAWRGGILDTIRLWVMYAVEAVKNAIRAAAAWIAQTATAVATTVAAWAAAAARTVAHWAVMAAGAVTNAAKVAAVWIAQTASTIATTLAAWAVAAAKTVAQWVIMAAGATANALIVAGAWLLQNGVAIVTSLAALAVAVATTIAGWVTMAVGAMINAAIVAAAWLIAFWPVVLIVAIVAAVVIAIIMYWDEIVAAFQAGAQWISDAMNAAWQWIQQAWDWILQKFQEAWDAIVNFFTGIWNSVVEGWNNIVQAFQDAGQAVLDALNATWQWIQDVWDSILNFFRSIPGWIKDVFTGAINWLVNFGQDILNGLWNGIKTIWNAVSGWFAQVGGWIKGAFSAAGSWLLDIGKSIIQGLWNGIVSVKDWILDKISGFIGNIIGGIKSFFGISSPSKVTHEIGMNVGQGLANGIQDSMPIIADAFGDVVRLGEVSMQQWDALVAAGWKGRPDDGMEALYRPTTPNGVVDWGTVSEGQWNALLAAGWHGDPNDHKEALYPPDYFKNMQGAFAGAITSTLTPGSAASLTNNTPYTLDVQGNGRLALAGQTRSDPGDPSAGSDASGKVIKIEMNTYNPLPEKASDNEARQLRAAAAVGAF